MTEQANSSLKRRLQIVELVRRSDEVKVEALSAHFGVSTVTIRSDLNYLEQQGYVVRAFGKARYNAALLGGPAVAPEAHAASRASAEALVSQAALRWIDDGFAVFLGGGSLVHRVLPQMVAKQGLALTLHDLGMVASARQFLGCEIHVTGGALNADEPGLVGPAAEAGLRAQRLDLAVFEVSGVDSSGRLRARHPGAARLYATAARHCGRVLALATELDFTATTGHPVCNVSEIDGIALTLDVEPGVFDLLAEHSLKVHRKAQGLIEFERA